MQSDANRTAERILEEMLPLIGTDIRQHCERQFELVWGLPSETQVAFAIMALRRHFPIIQYRFPRWRPPESWLAEPAVWCRAHGFRLPRLPKSKFNSVSTFVDAVEAFRYALMNIEGLGERTHAVCFVVNNLATARALHIRECDEPQYSKEKVRIFAEESRRRSCMYDYIETRGEDVPLPSVVEESVERIDQYFTNCSLDLERLRERNCEFEPPPPSWQLQRAIPNVAESAVQIREWHVAFNWLSQPEIRTKFVRDHGAGFQAMARWRDMAVWYEAPSFEDLDQDESQA